MKIRVLDIIGGVTAIVIGYKISQEGWLHLYEVPVPKWVGWVLVGFGALIIVTALRSARKPHNGANDN